MIDSKSNTLYTKSELEQVAEMAAKSVVYQLLHAPPNLDSRIIHEGVRSSCEEGESAMSSTYRESYSYIDEHGNTQTIRFSGKNKRETDAKFQEFLCGTKKESPTLRSYVDTTYRKSYIDHLAPTTKSNYGRYLDHYILPFMGDIKMNEITLSTIQDFYDRLATAKSHGFQQDVNKKSIDRIGGLLSRILSIAAEMKVIQESPFKSKLLKNNGKPSGHHKPLPDEEVDRVKREIPLLKNEQQRVYMGFLAYTGLRREEILGLGWEHINLEEGYGVVHRVAVYPDNSHPVIKNTPKTKYSERTFILPQPLLDILAPVENKTGFIVHGENPENAIAMSSFGKMYRSAFKQLGISGYNNHDWRTTFGTQLKEAGMSSAQIADMMGHADTRMVETVYAPRRHEGIMKHKNTIDMLNQAYACGTGVVPKAAIQSL